MKIALAQLNYHIGNFESNIQKIINSVSQAKSNNADLIVFSELAISGYPPRDFLEFDDFINKCLNAIEIIAKECVDIAAIIGAPSRNNNGKGKPLYNSAYFLKNGKVDKIIHKTLLPNYDIFDEYRYFEPNKKFELIECTGNKIALTICEDIWDITSNPLYTINPMDELAKLNPDFIVNIAASPFNYNQAEIRKNILKDNTDKYIVPLFYVNHVGAQTEILFDGGSLAMNSKGEIVEELKYFDEDFKIIDTDTLLYKDKIKQIVH
ncbi:MAG: NAD+ synthase, partial [Bacteroidetes bacterium]|nr:NAD+ synthase [Bacteroidota bacterium]